MSRIVAPYGDTTADGRIQVSFTLPVEQGARGEAAAVALAEAMGMHGILVAHQEQMTPGYTFFVVYGASCHTVDLDALEVPERGYERLTPPEVDQVVRATLKRRAVVLGANIETDAHTVGLDAILNMKGFAGDKGLEYYRELEVHNLGAQVDSERLVELARQEAADIILISQVVTEKDAHKHQLGRFVGLLTDAGLRERTIVVAGGPRMQAAMAPELGLDAVFGKGTLPSDVASYLAHELARRAGA